MTDGDLTPTKVADQDGGDPLAELIRAAGHRPTPSAADYERVRLASHLAWQMKVHAVRRRRVLWFALAASVAAAAIAVLVAPPTRPEPPVAEIAVLKGQVERLAAATQRWEPLTAATAIEAGDRLRTVGNGGAAFTLANGISVRADGATGWVFEAPTRLVLELGTLYVDTGRFDAGPTAIEIATSHGVVHDIGTQFEVRALTSELRVRVREGRVELQPRASAELLETPAGEELRLAFGGAIERRSIATDSAEWGWAEALAVPVELDGGTAFEALQWVARETGKRLVFEDANAELLARNAIIHGSSAGLEPLQILEVVMTTSAGLDYTLGDGTLVIRRR